MGSHDELQKACHSRLFSPERHVSGLVSHYARTTQAPCGYLARSDGPLEARLRGSIFPPSYINKVLIATQDIGIATYLMLLWKGSYPPPTNVANVDVDETQPWKYWPRPPGGFLDFGYIPPLQTGKI